MMKRPLLGSIFLLCLSGVSACQDSDAFQYLLPDRTGEIKKPIETGNTPKPTPTPRIDDDSVLRTQVTDPWTQPTPGTLPLDLIFVFDTSGSLVEERQKVVDSLSRFLEGIESFGISDYCIGVTEAHMGSRSGTLVSALNTSSCLCSVASNKAILIQDFRENLTALREESISDGGEAGFPAMQSYLNERALRAGTSGDVGCYRSEAALALVAVSDENEISTSGNSSCLYDGSRDRTSYLFDPVPVSTVEDPNCIEADARASSVYSDFDPLSGIHRLRLDDRAILGQALHVQGDKPFRAAIIGYVSDADLIPGAENSLANGYIELAEGSGGYKVEIANAVKANDVSLPLIQRAIAEAEFASDLGRLGESLARGANLLTSFLLSKPVCSDRTPQVKVDGLTVSFDFNRSENRVTLRENVAGTSGSLIEIQYETCTQR